MQASKGAMRTNKTGTSGFANPISCSAAAAAALGRQTMKTKEKATKQKRDSSLLGVIGISSPTKLSFCFMINRRVNQAYYLTFQSSGAGGRGRNSFTSIS